MNIKGRGKFKIIHSCTLGLTKMTIDLTDLIQDFSTEQSVLKYSNSEKAGILGIRDSNEDFQNQIDCGTLTTNLPKIYVSI